MIRTQIQLTSAQVEQLKRLSAKRGISMAELIRQSIDQFLQATYELSREEQVLRLKEAAGMYSTGEADVAQDHDQYLDDVYGDFRQ